MSEDVPWNVSRLWRGEYEVGRDNKRGFLVKGYLRQRERDCSCGSRQGGGYTWSSFPFVYWAWRCCKVDVCGGLVFIRE